MVESTIVNEASRLHVLTALASGAGTLPGGPDWTDFRRRFDLHFPGFYGSRPDWLEQLTALLLQAARSRTARPTELKVLDAERERNSGWFQSSRMLGGVCYVDPARIPISRSSASPTCT